MRTMLLITSLFFTLNSHSKTDVLYVTPAQINNLEAMFNEAKTPGAEIHNTRWNCRMYGKRSLTYKKHPVVLYDLKRNKQGLIQNSGSHITKVYTSTSAGLVGKRKMLTDTVRITNKNLLVSRLTLNSGSIVSYSVCRSNIQLASTN